MGQYQVTGPDGGEYQFEAATDEEAAAAVDELFSTAGGGQPQQAPPAQSAPAQPDPAAVREAFSGGFDPSQDSAATAEGLDQRLNGEADDRGRWATAGNALTMGFGDEALGTLAGGLTWIQGEGFEKGYRAITEGVRNDIAGYAERHPMEHAAIDIAASLPTAAIPGGAAVRGASLGAKVMRGAGAGAAYGGARGFGEGEGGVENRVENAAQGAAMGGAVGGAAPVAGNALGKAVGRRLGRAQVPSTQQLDDAATALYQRADNAGVAVQPRAVQRLTSVLPQRMANMGFDPVLHPNTARAIQVIEQRVSQAMQPTGGAHTVMSLGEVENIRRIIRSAVSASSGPDKKADRLMAGRVLDQFDMWMGGLQPKDMLSAGPVSGREAIQIVQEARGLWSRKSKGDVLADMVERAQLDDNFEMGLRREFRTLSRNKERMRQFTKGEQSAIRKVAKGGDMGWIMRALGSFSPTSLGGAVKGAAVSGIGVATGNPVAAALPVIGYGAKKVSDAATRRAARDADAIVRAGGSVPVSPKGKVVGDYATRLLGAAGQAVAPQFNTP